MLILDTFEKKSRGLRLGAWIVIAGSAVGMVAIVAVGLLFLRRYRSRVAGSGP
jgi:hypothetical protein